MIIKKRLASTLKGCTVLIKEYLYLQIPVSKEFNSIYTVKEDTFLHLLETDFYNKIELKFSVIITAKKILALVALKQSLFCYTYCCVVTALPHVTWMAPLSHLVVYKALIEVRVPKRSQKLFVHDGLKKV